MSTGHMPNPPDHLTSQTGQTVADQAAPVEGPSAEAPPLSLAEEMARIIEEQADVIAQKQLYHAQTMVGVSAVGTDVVNARNAALVIADALRTGDHTRVEHVLANLGDPQVSQVNDRTLPFRFNLQIAGLLEGIIIETISTAYAGDSARIGEARLMLEQVFQPANELLLAQPKSPPMLQASAFTPETPRLTGPGSTG